MVRKHIKLLELDEQRPLYGRKNLEHVIAASFDPKGDAAQVVTFNWNEGGVMILSAQDKLRSSLHMI